MKPFGLLLKENNENLWFSSQDSKKYFSLRGVLIIGENQR
jgi:hypothetical protein